MAEPLQRNRLYEYKANSNLVLEAERDKRGRRDEGSAEVETLFGKLDGIKMGDKSVRKSDNLGDSEDKILKRAKIGVDDNTHLYKPIKSNAGIVETHEVAGYKPKTRDTKACYEEILYILHSYLGDQPSDIMKGAADEVISIIKSDSTKDTLKMNEISKIIGRLSNEGYSKLVNLSNKLIDFSVDNNDHVEEIKIDDEIGVAVVFDDDDDRDFNLDDEAVNEDEDQSIKNRFQNENVPNQLKGSNNIGANIVENDIDTLPTFEIDAYWLQRQISKFVQDDANASASLSEKVLSALSVLDERLCENQLVLLLDVERFDFIKKLLKNRFKIYYCTRYRQSQNDEERKSIELEMMNDVNGEGMTILRDLNQKSSAANWTQDRIGEFTSKTRKEVMALSTNVEVGMSDVDDSTFIVDTTFSGSSADDKVTLDLESLVFSKGAHFMSNQNCELPSKSWRALKKGYEEVHIPAIRPVIPGSETLTSICDLPDWTQQAFDGIKSLNRIQSKMLNATLYGSENILLCAPTGAGKTNVALLCMLNQLGNYRLADGTYDLNRFKIVYIAPMKALVQECVQNFSKRLSSYGIKVNELSGDHNLSKQQLMETQVVVTTPEKWDIITRKSGDKTSTQLVKLIIIDEIHLLHDSRGPVLEALVARTLRYIESSQDMIRLVGLSATLPNFEDVATFLRVNPEKGLFFFDNSYRPVPLQQQYIGITEKKAIRRFHLMNEICYEKVLQHAGKNQVLIFTHSRADTVKTAKALRDFAIENNTLSNFIKEDSASFEILRDEAGSDSIKNPDLKDLLPFGFAVHHAGLMRSDRTLVEDLFADKHIQVLVSTATLAWGVNLPCHTVIIKGTQIYSPELGSWVEMSPLDVMQMMGRAGRYGLDTEGEGIILTTHNELQYYLSLLNQQLPIESQMIKKLPDALNAEIVLGNVSTITEASNWIGYTYLYVRMMRNPSLYGISDTVDDPYLSKRRADLAHTAAVTLEKHDLIKYDRRSGLLHSNSLGRISSYYYVNHESMKVYNDHLTHDMSEIEIFRIFSLSDEFKNMFVREDEKLELAKLISRVPIPIKESIEETSAKVNVLLQSYISKLRLEGFSLSADMIYIQQSACRLLRALFEICLKKGWATCALKLLSICKIAERRMWLSQSPLRQFGSIPELIIRRIEKSGDIPWNHFFDLKSQDFGEMVKIPKMGKTLHKYVHMFPKVELSAFVLPITRSMIKIELTITPDFNYDFATIGPSIVFWLFVHDVDGTNILHWESYVLNYRNSSQDHIVTLFVPIYDPLPPQYFVRVISDRWIGAESIVSVSFRHLVLPNKFPPSTELLDLQPLPIKAIKNVAIENYFGDRLFFNAIQTQVFSSIYETDENVLVCSPAKAGHYVLSELAIIRYLNKFTDGKCVYISPREEVVESLYQEWHSKFLNSFNFVVGKVTGDINFDLKVFDSADIIISSVDNWYAVSKRWRLRKSFQSVGLYIFDDLHYVGGIEGHVYEVLVSRVRYAYSQLEKPVRIIGFSYSLANAKDVGEWLAAANSTIFNFAPSSRTIPLNLHLIGFDNTDLIGRVQAMTKPTFNIILSNLRPAIVFVPSSKQSQLSAIDFLTFCNNNPTFTDYKAPHAKDNYLHLFDFDNKTLSKTVQNCIGFYNDELSSTDKMKIQSLFKLGFILILVVPHRCAVSLQCSTSLLVLMDPVVHTDDYRRMTDLKVNEILEILGTVYQENFESPCKSYILCHSSKKDYLKRILLDSVPIESHLNHYLHDHLNSEIVSQIVENKQDAVDFLTWTFLYRRLPQNANYYSLTGSTHRHLSDYLSDLVESVSSDLESSKCIAIDDDFDLRPLNLGMISSYYSIGYTTIELFSSSLTAKTKIKGLIEVISSSPELASLLIVRDNEEIVINRLLAEQSFVSSQSSDGVRKAVALIYAHLSRFSLNSILYQDLKEAIAFISNYIPAIIDVIASKSWLKPAIAAMELSQMITQGVRSQDSILWQIPHITEDIIDKLSNFNPPIESVYDFIEVDDDVRLDVLQMSKSQLSDVALFCNSYPSVDVTYEISSSKASSGDTISLQVHLNFDADERYKVIASRYPGVKSLGWWIFIGDDSSNSLLSIKRILNHSNKVNLTFNAQEDPGEYELTLYVINDSYLGCDQEFKIPFSVGSDIAES